MGKETFYIFWFTEQEIGSHQLANFEKNSTLVLLYLYSNIFEKDAVSLFFLVPRKKITTNRATVSAVLSVEFAHSGTECNNKGDQSKVDLNGPSSQGL